MANLDQTKRKAPAIEDALLSPGNAQEGTLLVSAAPLYSRIGLNHPYSSTQVCATITAHDIPQSTEGARAPVDILVALDVSGSMHGEKLDQCKETLGLLLHELRPNDRFGLISFSTHAIIEIPVRKLESGGGKESVLAHIHNLETRNTTNISAGCGLAIQELRDVENPNAVRTVFLLTDGHANQGITSSQGIVDLVRGYMTSDICRSPITIHTFGYGADHDQRLLRDISSSTPGGTYYFVDNDSNLASAFGDALGGVLSVVAQNATLKISVPSKAACADVKIIDIHHKTKFALEDGSWKVSLDDFYAEESRDIVFEVSLASSTCGEICSSFNSSPVPHAQVSLSYLDTIANQPRSTECSLQVLISRPIGSEVSPPHLHVAVQWMRVSATEAMESAEEMACEGQLQDARELISNQLRDLDRKSAEVGVESNPLVIQLKSDLGRVLEGFMDRHKYDLYGRHRISQVSQAHYMQRCNEADESAVTTYRTGGKRVRVQRFSKRSRTAY